MFVFQLEEAVPLDEADLALAKQLAADSPVHEFNDVSEQSLKGFTDHCSHHMLFECSRLLILWSYSHLSTIKA